MSTSPLSPQEIRAAAETHDELGPEYSDAVIGIFIACGPLIALIGKSALAALIGIPLFWAVAAAIAISHARSLRNRLRNRDTTL